MLNLRPADTNTISDSTARTGPSLSPARLATTPASVSRAIRTDEELVAAISRGDENAFSDLARRYRWLIRRMSFRFRFPGGDNADVEQAALVALWDSALHFRADRGASFRTFAEMHVSHRVGHGLGAATAKKHAALNTAQSLDAPPPWNQASLRDPDDAATLGDYLTDGVDLHDEIERAEASASARLALMRAERQLSEQEAFALEALVAGTSLVEAARAFGCSPQAMGQAAARGRRKIQAFLSRAKVA